MIKTSLQPQQTEYPVKYNVRQRDDNTYVPEHVFMCTHTYNFSKFVFLSVFLDYWHHADIFPFFFHFVVSILVSTPEP